MYSLRELVLATKVVLAIVTLDVSAGGSFAYAADTRTDLRSGVFAEFRALSTISIGNLEITNLPAGATTVNNTTLEDNKLIYTITIWTEEPAELTLFEDVGRTVPGLAATTSRLSITADYTVDLSTGLAAFSVEPGNLLIEASSATADVSVQSGMEWQLHEAKAVIANEGRLLSTASGTTGDFKVSSDDAALASVTFELPTNGGSTRTLHTLNSQGRTSAVFDVATFTGNALGNFVGTDIVVGRAGSQDAPPTREAVADWLRLGEAQLDWRTLKIARIELGISEDGGSYSLSGVEVDAPRFYQTRLDLAGDLVEAATIQQVSRTFLGSDVRMTFASSDFQELAYVPGQYTYALSLLAKRNSLEFANHVLELHPSPRTWDLGFFLGASVLRTTLGAIDGTKVVYRGAIKPLEGLTVEIRDLAIAADGASRISFTVEATLRGVSVSLGVEAYVALNSVIPPAEEGGPSLAVVRVLPVSVTPNLFVDGKQYSPNPTWSATALDVAALLIEPKLLQFTIPVAQDFGYRFPADFNATQEVNKDTGGTLTYHVDLPEGRLGGSIWHSGPVLTDAGFWIFGFLDAAGALRSYQPTDMWYYDLSPRIAELSSRIAERLQPLEAIGPDQAAISLGRDLFDELAGFASALTPSQRRVAVRTLAASGYLHQDKWYDDFLGDGGIFVSLDPGDSGAARIAFAPPRYTWAAPNGVSIALPVEAQVSGSFNVHIDPLIGGGIGVPITLVADIGGAVSVNASLRLFDEDRVSALQLVPSIACGAVEADAYPGVGFDEGWVAVSSIGVRVKYPFGRKQPDKIPLLDNRPHFIDFAAEAASLASDGWTLQPKNRAVVVTLTPALLEQSSDALLAAATYQVLEIPWSADQTTVSNVREAVALERQRITSKLALTLPTADNGGCDDQTHFRVLIDGFEIGPNNELVKFAERVWGEVKKAPKALRELGESILDEGEKILKGGGTVIKDVGDAVGNALGW